MKAVVTGVAGFIGSHLAERLLAEGMEVVGIDCFSATYPRAVKERNLAALTASKRFRLIEADISDLDLGSVLGGAAVVFHQAAVAGVRRSWGREFKLYVDNNVLVTQLLLKASLEAGVGRFIYASSSSVYGNQTRLPVGENSLLRPYSPYGVTKLAGENLCLLYHDNYGLETVALRYFTVYGPRQRPDMGIHIFLARTMAGDEINVFGDGTQSRDFTYVDDVVEANLLAMRNGTAGTVYNIGRGEGITLNEVLDAVERVVGRPPRLRYVPSQKGDVPHTLSDITRARSHLGYEPSTGFADGLRAQFEWLRSNRDVYGL